MKKLLAIYRPTRSAGIRGMIADYNTKKNFKQDIKGNGYRLIAILNEKQVKEIYGKKLVSHCNFKGLAKQASYEIQQDILDYINNLEKVKKEFNL